MADIKAMLGELSIEDLELVHSKASELYDKKREANKPKVEEVKELVSGFAIEDIEEILYSINKRRDIFVPVHFLKEDIVISIEDKIEGYENKFEIDEDAVFTEFKEYISYFFDDAMVYEIDEIYNEIIRLKEEE